MRYRNMGGAWRRSSGQLLQHGQEFEPDERELQRMTIRRQIGTRFVAVESDDEFIAGLVGRTTDEAPDSDADGAGPAADGEEVQVETDAEEEEEKETPPEEWPLRMSPAQYLKLHADGPRAALARAHVEWEASHGTDT